MAAAVAQRMDEMASGRRIPIRYGDGLGGAEGCRPWPGTERITAAFRMAWVAAGGCVAGTGSIRPGKAAAGRVAAYQAAARRRSPLEGPDRDKPPEIPEQKERESAPPKGTERFRHPKLSS